MKKYLLLVVIIIMLSVSSVASAVDCVFWGFDTLGGYIISGVTQHSISDSILSAVTDSTDPTITINTNFSGDDYSEIQIRMKHDIDNRIDGKNLILQVFYIGTDSNGDAIPLAEANSVNTVIQKNSEGKYITYSLLFDKANFKGSSITSLRIDPVNSTGSFDIDYIMLVPTNPNSDLFYGFDNGLGIWSTENLASYEVEGGIISGTSSASNGILRSSRISFNGADYKTAYARMKFSGLSQNRSTLLYTDLVDQNGTTVKPLFSAYEGYSSVNNSVLAANNDKFSIYKYDFSPFSAYLENRITQAALNMVNLAGVPFEFDYLLFKNPRNLTWDFLYTDFSDGWTFSDANFSVSDGVLKYTTPAAYLNPRITLSGLSLDADSIDGIEIVMKHDITVSGATSDNVQVYYSGKDENGAAFGMSEDASIKKALKGVASESFHYYYFDLKSAMSWSGSTINSIRIDPLNKLGSCEIDYIRLISAQVVESGPLEADHVALSYTFENNNRASAQGVISVDFNGQNRNYAKNVKLVWATKDTGSGYTDLDGYTSIRSFTGSEIEAGYTIKKDLVIPVGADALCAYVTDSEKTFPIYFDLPDGKKAQSKQPLYTAAFISDLHFGGWGSESNYVNQQIKAYQQVDEMADFVIVNGDITQWYGEKARESQWVLARNYFEQFTIPVYLTQGNHDIPNASMSEETHSFEYFKDFLANWIEYSSQNNQYEIYRDPSVNYYDTEINGHHYIFLSIPNNAIYRFGDAQLKWLDQKLFEKEQSGKPIFVFGHIASNQTIGYLHNTSIGDDVQLKEILSRHPSAIYTSGHSHLTLNTDLVTTINGAQIEPSFIHDGGVINLREVVDKSISPDGLLTISGSMGVFVEIYEDNMLVRGRDFLGEQWVSRGLYEISFKNSCPINEFSVIRFISNGETKLFVQCLENDSDVTYTWYLDGTEYSTGRIITIESDFNGFIAVRAEDNNDNYRSEAYDHLNEIPWAIAIYKITYNANGGSFGTTTDWTASTNYSFVSGTPTKEGKQFMGWSTDGTESGIVASLLSINSDVTVTAIWGPIFTLCFDENADFSLVTNMPIPVRCEIGSVITLASFDTPVRKYHEFLGWSADGTEENIVASITMTENLMLKAVWKMKIFSDNIALQLLSGTKSDSETTSLRFLFGFNSLEYAEAGFIIAGSTDLLKTGYNRENDNRSVKITNKVAYKSVIAASKTYSADELFGTKYMVSLEITEIPSEIFDDTMRIQGYLMSLETNEMIFTDPVHISILNLMD